MKVTFDFWGTSDAQGVPRLLCDCTVCTSRDERNRRTRPSMLVKTGQNHLLIDLSPDFRTQFLRVADKQIPQIILFTHAHHDHIGGLGDFADLCAWNHARVTLVSPEDVVDTILTRFPYLANRPTMSFQKRDRWQVGDIEIGFHRVNHGANGYAYGIRFSTKHVRFAYISDAISLSAKEWEPFHDLDCLILGTSYWKEEAPLQKRSVYSVEEVIPLLGKLRPKRVYLTHLSHDIDVAAKEKLLPEHTRFAYDGLQVVLEQED